MILMVMYIDLRFLLGSFRIENAEVWFEETVTPRKHATAPSPLCIYSMEFL